MEILYVSRLTSERLLNEIYKGSGKNPGFAIQKFSRLLTRGFVENGAKVTSLSSPPYNSKNTSKWAVCVKDEDDYGVHFSYIPFLKLPVIKSLVDFCFVFYFIIKWYRNNKTEKAVVFDVLNVSACMSGILACKFCKVDNVGIVTDMPGMMNSRQNKSIKGTLATFINNRYLWGFNRYVFLTEQMNKDINVKKRPYIIMEGVVDADMYKHVNSASNQKRVVLYAGGLHERYGLRLLVEGFVKADVQDSELWIYGNGPFVDKLQEYCSSDNRIIYKGVRPNKEVVEAELKATLLVNPRPTSEDFTKYSFPSKNLEYMVSGTPVLTTILPGMPIEYHKYVYLFDKGETVDGYASVLNQVLSLPFEQLQEKGKEARQWVLQNKNNYLQARRIIDLLWK